MLASFGMALVPVFRRPVVAILSTGDELVELGVTPGAGRDYQQQHAVAGGCCAGGRLHPAHYRHRP